MILGANHYLLLGLVLFGIGTIGVLVRRNILIILMSVELMINAVNLLLVAFSRYNGNLDGQVFTFFTMVVFGFVSMIVFTFFAMIVFGFVSMAIILLTVIIGGLDS